MFTIILLTSIVVPGLMGKVGKAPKLPEPKLPIKEKGDENLEGIVQPPQVSIPGQE